MPRHAAAGRGAGEVDARAQLARRVPLVDGGGDEERKEGGRAQGTYVRGRAVGKTSCACFLPWFHFQFLAMFWRIQKARPRANFNSRKSSEV